MILVIAASLMTTLIFAVRLLRRHANLPNLVLFVGVVIVVFWGLIGLVHLWRMLVLPVPQTATEQEK
jgi:hypothetical protein